MPSIRQITSTDGTAGFALDALPDEVVSAFRWDAPGELLKPGSRSTVTCIEVGETPYVVKQYRSLSLRRRLRYALTRSRARQSWQNGQAMAALGIPVVQPLAFLEERQFGIPGRAALIMPFQQGIPIDELSVPEYAKVIEPLRAVFAAMAALKVSHGDMKASNILIDHRAQVHLIDIDASIIHQRESTYLKARAKDEARFLRNWQGNPEALEAFKGIF